MIELFFTDTVTVIHKTIDRFEQAGEDIRQHRCRFEKVDNVRLNINGKDTYCSHRIFFSASSGVNQGDSIVFGSQGTGVNDKRCEARTVSRMRGFLTSHLEVLV